MRVRNTAALLSAVAAVLVAGEAEAHARLIASTPAKGATVAAPKQLVLKFSEKLQPAFSSAQLMKGGAETPSRSVVARDRTTMIVTPVRPLTAGAYRIHWRAVAADTHTVQGDVAFTVR
jgi:methionine-rich copper-binding protein CopC